MKILIVGDSFAADWSAKCTAPGWPNLLKKFHEVTNLAQAGVSEYKIYKQLTSVNLDLFDLIIVVHTSPYRVVTRRHPVHVNDLLHKDADLLFSDIEHHYKSVKRFFNRSLRSAYNFFIYHFDREYQETTYKLLVEKIEKILYNKLSITITTPISLNECIRDKNLIRIDSSQIVKGSPNHMSGIDNQVLLEKILQTINEIKQP